MRSAKTVQECILEGTDGGYGNVPHEAMGAAVEHCNLLPNRHGTVLRLDKELIVLPTLIQSKFSDFINIR